MNKAQLIRQEISKMPFGQPYTAKQLAKNPILVAAGVRQGQVNNELGAVMFENREKLKSRAHYMKRLNINVIQLEEKLPYGERQYISMPVKQKHTFIAEPFMQNSVISVPIDLSVIPAKALAVELAKRNLSEVS